MSKPTSNAPHSRRPNKLDLNELSELIKVESFEAYDDFYIENNYCQCSDDLQNEGKCECGFEDERGLLYSRYCNAVENIARDLLKEHGLILVKNEKKFNYRIMPQVSWLDACRKVMTTIEGYGMFGYGGDVREFMRSGPYTAREGTLSHLHWLKEWFVIYGDTNAESRLERAMRY